MQVHIQNDGPVTIELESPAPGAATSDPKQVNPALGCVLWVPVTSFGFHLVPGAVLNMWWTQHFIAEFILIHPFSSAHTFPHSALAGRDSTSALSPPDLGIQRKCPLQRAQFFPFFGEMLFHSHATGWQQSSSTTPLGFGLAGSPIQND